MERTSAAYDATSTYGSMMIATLSSQSGHSERYPAFRLRHGSQFWCGEQRGDGGLEVQ